MSDIVWRDRKDRIEFVDLSADTECCGLCGRDLRDCYNTDCPWGEVREPTECELKIMSGELPPIARIELVDLTDINPTMIYGVNVAVNGVLMAQHIYAKSEDARASAYHEMVHYVEKGYMVDLLDNDGKDIHPGSLL